MILARFLYDLGLIFGTIWYRFCNSVRGSANFGNTWVCAAQRVVSNKSLLPINSTHQKKVRAFRPAHAAQFARTVPVHQATKALCSVLSTRSVLQLCCWDDVNSAEGVSVLHRCDALS